MASVTLVNGELVPKRNISRQEWVPTPSQSLESGMSHLWSWRIEPLASEWTRPAAVGWERLSVGSASSEKLNFKNNIIIIRPFRRHVIAPNWERNYYFVGHTGPRTRCRPAPRSSVPSWTSSSSSSLRNNAISRRTSSFFHAAGGWAAKGRRNWLLFSLAAGTMTAQTGRRRCARRNSAECCSQQYSDSVIASRPRRRRNR